MSKTEIDLICANADRIQLQNELNIKSKESECKRIELALFKSQTDDIITQYKDQLEHAKQTEDIIRYEKACEIKNLKELLIKANNHISLYQSDTDNDNDTGSAINHSNDTNTNNSNNNNNNCINNNDNDYNDKSDNNNFMELNKEIIKLKTEIASTINAQIETKKKTDDSELKWMEEKRTLEEELTRVGELLTIDKDRFLNVELNLIRKLNESEILTAKLQVEKIIALEDLHLQLLDFAAQFEEQADTFSSKLDAQELYSKAQHDKEIEEINQHFEKIINKNQQKFDIIEQKLENSFEKLLMAEKLSKLKSEYVEHDPTVLGHLLAETKIEYALQKCENEELQQKYRKLELITCEYKLQIAAMEEEKDDMLAMRRHVEALISESPSKIIRK